MTSGIGDRRLSQRRWHGGFTLVEIIVVMAIVVLLFGLVAVSLSQYLGRASKSATQALILRLEQHLDEYHRIQGSYPPDGIDSVVRTEDGEEIQGSACLYYFLLSRTPSVERRNVGGKLSIREHAPVATFKESELTPVDPAHPGVREILDGWATPIHYDNTEDEVFRPQRGEVHFPPLGDSEHPPDPRSGEVQVDGQDVVVKAGIQSPGFDIWSHGDQGHDVDEPPSMPVATWNKD